MPQAVWPLRTTAILCLCLLFGGLLFDLSSTQQLVVAIIYNIPIALSGLALSKRLTLWLLVLAMLANLAAAYTNTLQTASFDQISLFNRALASLSFLLVALMTLAFDRASSSLVSLSETEALLKQERDLRQLLIALSRQTSRSALLDATVRLLHPFLEAEAVHLVAVHDDIFVLPHLKSPEHSRLIQTGESASWATETLPVTAPAVVSLRSEQGVTTIGRLPQAEVDDLLIVVNRSKLLACSHLLGDIIEGLAALLERSQQDGHV